MRFVAFRKRLAEVTKLEAFTLKANEYTAWPDGDTTIDRPLDIVVNFQAKETLVEAQASPYGKWAGDFYVTVTGIKEGTLKADGCYLAGNYGEYGWVVVPMGGLEITEGVSNPVVAVYDRNLTYENICDYVKDFTAAIHISDAILAENPNLEIELALKLKNPTTGDFLVVGDPVVYKVEDLRGEDYEAKLPEADVTALAPTTLNGNDYMVWPSGDDTIDRPLDIVVNFKAKESKEEAEASVFGKWAGDFYVTVTGIEEGKLTAAGCYLAGKYDPYGWVVVPMDGLEITEGVSNPVVAVYDANLTYENICDYVRDFTAAIHISDEIIAANPKLKIELALKLKNPTTGEYLVVGDPVVYSVGDLREPVAKIGEKAYVTLEAAFAAANDGDTVTLLANVETEGSYAINKKVVLDLNGKTITGTDNATKSFGLINIQPGAELTINDTVGDGKITLKATQDRDWNAYSSVISNQRGKLIVNGGTIEHLGGTDMAYAIDNLTNGTGTHAETLINGGTIKSTYRAIRQFLNGVEAQNILKVSGGTIEGTNKAIWMQDSNAYANPGKLTVGENAVLKGNVYLDAAAGTTEWPVEVSVAKAAFDGESTVITDKDTPYGYKVVDADGVFVVKCEKLAGKGTEEDPYLIKSVDDLILFRDSVNAGETVYNADGVYVALDDNVNLKGLDWSVNIGDDANNTFDGIFDGKGYSISNLTSTETAAKSDGYICTGLFGAIGGNAVIKNLTINNVAIDAGEYNGNVVGSVVGFAYGSTGTIENVRVTGNISIKGADATSVGAIVGYAYDGSLTIKDCTVDGNTGSAITATSYVGGIVGYGGGQITVDNCTVQDINVTANNAAAGGVLGILCGGKATNNTVKNVNVKANHVNWLNSAGIVVGSISAPSTVSGTTFSNVTANDEATTTLVGSGHENKPATPVGKVEAAIGNVYYATIQAAVTAAKAGDIVTVIDDIEIANAIEIEAGKTVTLDLNGKTVTGVPTEAKAYAVIENKGDLTITGGGSVVCDHKLVGSTAYAVNTITNCGTLTIDGATVENKSSASSQIGYAIDNNSTSANAITVIKAGEVKASGSNYYDGIRQFCNSTTIENSVTVEGGTVSSIWMQNPSDGSTEKNTKDVKGSVEILGGNVGGLWLEPSTAFTAVITGGHTGEVGYFQTSEGRDLEGFISGGTFGADYTSFCAKGFACEVSGTDEEGNEIYGIVELSCVAVINEEQYYTLSAAFEAAESGDTITVLENVNITDTITVPAGKTVTLDLNGKTVTYTTDVNDADMIRNSGNLTIIDNSDAENGKLVFDYTGAANERSTSTIVNLPGSTLTVKSGTVENASDANGSYNYAIDSQTNGTLGTVTVNVEGGTVKSNYMAIRQFNNGEACANTLNVTGGTIEATRRAIQVHLKNNGAYTNISGGTIKGGDYSLCFLTTSENLSVTGGKFEGAVWYSGTDGFISGGTFDEPVSAGYCAEGYIPTTNTDGTYGVKEGEFVALNNNTSVEYATVAEALAVANSGDTVILGKKATEVGVLAVTNGITLDLNGNTLSANYVVAFGDADIVDNSANKTGVLKVDEKMFSIAADNAQMPVYDGDNGGYRFATMGMKQVKIDSVDSDSFKLRFKPSFGDVIAKLLADGAADNQVNIMITLSWTNSDGTLGSQEFIYPEDLIRNVYYDGSKNAFSFSCKGLGAMGLANKVKVRFSVVSNRGVHATSEEIDPWNK